MNTPSVSALLLLLAVAALFAVVFLLLPFVVILAPVEGVAGQGDLGALPAALGLGFMLLYEISMIQCFSSDTSGIPATR
ncbi:MAG: hypothetical protein R2789_10300 [Microthrixaceae bacterium]